MADLAEKQAEVERVGLDLSEGAPSFITPADLIGWLLAAFALWSAYVLFALSVSAVEELPEVSLTTTVEQLQPELPEVKESSTVLEQGYDWLISLFVTKSEREIERF